jgi:PBP1b-binding outer membrane lipoprotein LpoB
MKKFIGLALFIAVFCVGCNQSVKVDAPETITTAFIETDSPVSVIEPPAPVAHPLAHNVDNEWALWLIIVQ